MLDPAVTEMQEVLAELRMDFVVVLTGAALLPLVHVASVYS